MCWHLPWVALNNFNLKSPSDISTAQLECQWLKEGLTNISTIVWIMYYNTSLFFYFYILHDALITMWLTVSHLCSLPRLNIHMEHTVHDKSEHWVKLRWPTGCTAAAWLLFLYFYLWLCETGYMCVCVHVFRNSLIGVQWDVVRQQWLGGTAEWTDFLSMDLNLLGSLLAARLHTSPFLWPQIKGQEWGTGGSMHCCQGMKLQLCHFFLRNAHLVII